jgi:hypothetical protein
MSYFCNQMPLYWDELKKYPIDNPIFIAADILSLQFIRHFKGVCLLCDKAPNSYDFSFCFEREVWVLFSQVSLTHHAVQLAQIIQFSGAKKTLAFRPHIEYFQGDAYGNC